MKYHIIEQPRTIRQINIHMDSKGLFALVVISKTLSSYREKSQCAKIHRPLYIKPMSVMDTWQRICSYKELFRTVGIPVTMDIFLKSLIEADGTEAFKRTVWDEFNAAKIY